MLAASRLRTSIVTNDGVDDHEATDYDTSFR
jgi:hypothetical protein